MELWSLFPGSDVRTSKSGQVDGDFALDQLVGRVAESIYGEVIWGKGISRIDSPLFGFVKNFDLAQMSMLFSYSDRDAGFTKH